MKGIAVADAVKEYDLYEDQRARFRYPSHMEDFEDLRKETESMRKKLQMMKEQRSTLLSEVKFLKRRREFLVQNQSTAERHFMQPQNVVFKSKSNLKAKKSTGKGASLSRAMGSDLKHKQQKSFGGKEEPTLRSSLSVLDLNQKERLCSGKEATARSMKPNFDLNQISREEEELQAQSNAVGIEDFKRSSIRIGSDEQHNDVKISACRNTGNRPSRTGKRKISWQDQVALRV
ncbi:INO80-BINDING PROTEIN 2B [Hibiscus trionum]|uniref:INO80-BINDING PROTEIN 2B n=1 Tax=Hibiscus trionum TaxID=183268 RepID=A0A9W7IDR1_HIBTR|nr:INO80-BINDING PROTEIN 2B [Hibiscus trionum]